MLDFNAHYQVKGWEGIAWWLDKYPQIHHPNVYTYIDENGTEVEEWMDDEGEWVDDLDCGQVLAVMVGDDKRHRIDISDLIPLGELDYCAECGQVGCTHDGRDRSE